MSNFTGITNLPAFRAQLEKFIQDSGMEYEELFKLTAFRVLRGVVQGTPVDTGRAQGNWFVGIGTINESVDENARGAAASLARGAEIDNMQGLQVINISNNLSYIVALANGHSKQAPAGWVDATVAGVESWLQAVVSV